MITDKLDAGVSNMDETTRAQLLSDLALLEQLLIENESRFFKNQNDYRALINAIKEKYFNLTDLEGKLTQSEAQRLEDQRVFRQRLLWISAIVIVFGLLILLLIYISTALRKEKRKLAEANDAIQHMNENLEAIVVQRTEMLSKAHRELDTFLYRASHDMRSPVRSIIGLCNIAGRLTEGEPRDLIDRVVLTSQGMDRLLKKLSIISEINQPTNFTSITLRDTIDTIQQSFHETLLRNRTKFEIDCPADLVMSSYPNIVHTIIYNLVENSIHYSTAENDSRIVVQARRVSDNLEIAVMDNGMGIDAPVRERIFEMFFKGTERSQGHGLGLYIVSKGVQALDGQIDFESRPGVSTTFRITLPLRASTNVQKKVTNEALELA